jgi:putative flippase GtrA
MGMKALGSLILAIIVGVLLLWLLLELFIGALKLVGVLIAVAAAVLVYFIAEKAIGKGR